MSSAAPLPTSCLEGTHGYLRGRSTAVTARIKRRSAPVDSVRALRRYFFAEVATGRTQWEKPAPPAPPAVCLRLGFCACAEMRAFVRARGCVRGGERMSVRA